MMPTPKQMGIELTSERRCPICGCLFSGEDWENAHVVAQATPEEYERDEAVIVIHHEDCFIAAWATSVQGKPLRLKRAIILGDMGGGI